MVQSVLTSVVVFVFGSALLADTIIPVAAVSGAVSGLLMAGFDRIGPSDSE